MGNPVPKSLLHAVEETLKVYGVSAIVSVLVLVLVPCWARWMFMYVVAVVFLSNVFARRVMNCWPRSLVNPEGKAVFISGCDSGFGHSLAQQLDDKGLHVFAGCLFPEGEGAKSLKKTASSRLHVVPLDVTSDDSIEKAASYFKANSKNKKLWALVNNAGIYDGQELLWTEVETMQRVLDVNTFGVVKLTKALLTTLIKDTGRVVTVCSSAGRYAYLGMVPYCMSKSAAIIFAEGLRMEMYHFGIKVITVEPWMYRTPITDEDVCKIRTSKAWERAPSEVKHLLPKDYLDRYSKKQTNMFNTTVNDEPQQVVDCLKEAVLAVNPKYTYSPGFFSTRTTFWFYSRMPRPIADFLYFRKFGISYD